MTTPLSIQPPSTRTRLSAAIAGLGLAATLGTAPVPALAQAKVLEEITVTARKREESLQQVPVAVTAFSAGELEARRIDNIDEIANFAPNVNFITNTGISGTASSYVFIRGIGQTEVFLQNDPGVGIYVDGVYLGRTQGSVMNLLDLERVEVLRGPQGTLFGRNTIGGAINLVSQKPHNELGGYVSLDVGDYDLIRARGKINIPFTDNFFGSAVIGQTEHDGYAEWKRHPQCVQVTAMGGCDGEDMSADDTLSGRLALRWLPTDDLTIDLAYDYMDRDTVPIGARLAEYDVASAAMTPLFGAIPPNFPPFNPTPNPIPSYADFVQMAWGVPITDFVIDEHNEVAPPWTGHDKQEVEGTSLTVEWAINDSLTFKSITGARSMEVDALRDDDGTLLQFSTAQQEIEQDQISQEFQFSGTTEKLDYIVGAFYFEEEGEDFLVQYAQNPERPFGPPCFSPTDPWLSCSFLNTFGDTDLEISNWALFSEVTWHFNTQWALTLGVRHSVEEKELQYSTNNPRAAVPPGGLDLDEEWESTTPKIGVEYTPSDNWLVYASYTEGFRSGTFNTAADVNLVTMQPIGRIVDPEEVKAYELGFKADVTDRIRLNGAYFFNDYTDFQGQSALTGGNFFAFFNVAEAEISGVELELTAQPTANLSIMASAGYTDSEITDVSPLVESGFNIEDGAPLARIPETDASVGVSYDWTMGNYMLTTRVDWTYVGEQEGDYKESDQIRNPSYDFWNLRLTYGPMDESWEVSLWSENVTDEEYTTALNSVEPAAYVIAVDGAPRTVGAGFKYRF